MMTQNSDVIDFHGQLKIPVETLLRGTMITGATGSGKTRCVIRPLLRQLLALHARDGHAKAGALVIDPKNELLGIVREALEKCGRERDLICIGPSPDEATYNPLANPKLTSTQITNMILAASTVVGQDIRMGRNERFWEQQDRSLLQALVTLARQPDEEWLLNNPLTFGALQKLRERLILSDKDVLAWAQRVAARIGLADGMPLLEFAALPGSTRACVVSSTGSLLDIFCRPPLSNVIQPQAKRREADLSSIFEDGKIIILNTARAESALELLPAQVLLAWEWARLVLARPRLGRNQVRPVWTVIDEAARVITCHGDPASDIMDMARASKVGVILALQNLAALHALGNPNAVFRLVGLASNHFFLSNTDPVTAAVAVASLGTKDEYQFHRTVTPALPPPLLLPCRRPIQRSEPGILVPSTQPVLPPGKLARLKPGEIYYRISLTSEVGCVLADPAAP